MVNIIHCYQFTCIIMMRILTCTAFKGFSFKPSGIRSYSQSKICKMGTEWQEGTTTGCFRISGKLTPEVINAATELNYIEGTYVISMAKILGI